MHFLTAASAVAIHGEAEPARVAGVLVHHHRGRLHGGGLHVHLTQTLTRRERQIPGGKICTPSQPPTGSPAVDDTLWNAGGRVPMAWSGKERSHDEPTTAPDSLTLAQVRRGRQAARPWRSGSSARGTNRLTVRPGICHITNSSGQLR